jgi:predicted pyridoxine 5'-phosphate oxidase superfamily flavin-nucleotide-binding protein
MEWADHISPDIASFIADATSFYLATASAEGQPYIQHRGGRKGFLHVLDDHTLAFADFVGNRQFITTGNLAENDRAHIFLMDYANRTRIKIWGHARVSDDKELLAKLMPPGSRARGEQVIIFNVAASDVNCRQHIPQKFDAADVAAALDHLKARIAELEAEITTLKSVS